MTMCKTFSSTLPVKGKLYKRSDLICDLIGFEKMASTYYDPPRDELYSFFDEGSKDWDNTFMKPPGIFIFKHKTIKTLGKTPVWECTKVRHVFLHRKGMTRGKYEYIGTAIGDKHLSKSGHDEKQYVIK